MKDLIAALNEALEISIEIEEKPEEVVEKPEEVEEECAEESSCEEVGVEAPEVVEVPQEEIVVIECEQTEVDDEEKEEESETEEEATLDEDVESLGNKIDKADTDLKELITMIAKNEEVQPLEDKKLAEIEQENIDIADLRRACMFVHYGFFEECSKELTPKTLKLYLENALKEETEQKDFHALWVNNRYPEALELVNAWLDKNAQTKINETKELSDEELARLYADNLTDPENLDNIWVIREFTDNMDSEDGKSLCKYTKIGLIDYINDRLEEEGAEDRLDNEISNHVIANGYLEYLDSDAELVEIRPYSVYDLDDEPNIPKSVDESYKKYLRKV